MKKDQKTTRETKDLNKITTGKEDHKTQKKKAIKEKETTTEETITPQKNPMITIIKKKNTLMILKEL